MLVISFIFMPAFPRGMVAEDAAAGLGISHGQQQFQIDLLAPHQDEAKQGRRYSHSTWVLGLGWLLNRFFVGLARWTCLASLSWGILDTWPNQYINISEKWFHIQGSANFTPAHFFAKCHTMDSSKKSNLCRFPRSFSVTTQESGS